MAGSSRDPRDAARAGAPAAREFLGRYELLGLLGRGSTTTTHQAKSVGVEGFEKRLVVKRLLPHLVQRGAAIDSFVEQAQRALRLTHTNVAQVFDLGRDDTTQPVSYFIATEHVAGLTLERLLQRSAGQSVQLPVELALYVASELGKGLDHAHRRRDEQLRSLHLVHGAVWPGNVLLSWEGEVKLADFCTTPLHLPQATGEVTAWAGAAQKAAFASPEQAHGKPATAASDLYSLAMVLYTMLAGSNPLHAPSVGATLDRVRAGRVPPLRGLRPDAPAELCHLLERALEREPTARIASASEFYEALLEQSYALGTRFGSTPLSSFLDGFREAAPSGAPSVGELLARALSTPPAPSVGAAPRVEPRPPIHAPHPLTVPPEPGLQRDVSALVLTLSGGALSGGLKLGAESRERCQRIVRRYGGHLPSDTHEDVVAWFGLDSLDGRDTEAAVRCALVLLRTLPPQNTTALLGIATGRLELAGTRSFREPAAAAALVRAATRVAALAPRRVTLVPSAAEHLRHAFNLEEVAGGGALVLTGLRSLHEATGPFVGRRAELNYLGELLARASRGELQTLAIVGEQGIGKTRLIGEVQRRLSRGGLDLAAHVAACPPGGHQVPYSALAAMLRRLCGVREEDSPERIEAVTPRLRALGLNEPELASVLGELGLRHPELAGSREALLQMGVGRILQSLAEDRFQLFVWDDAQCFDPQSTQLLRNLAQRLASARIAFVLAARPDEQATYHGLPFNSEMQLGELDATDAAQLVATRTGLSRVPATLLEFVRQRASGHPMFIEELVRALLESGGLRQRGGVVESLDLGAQLAIPRTLRSLLLERTARVPEQERRALVAAAILEPPIEVPVLAALLGVTPARAQESLDRLEAQDLLYRETHGHLAFVSPLTRDVLRADLSTDVARALHQSAASAYQQALPERLEAEARRIAHHLLAAGDDDAAAGFFATSGLYHSSLGHLETAATDMVRALGLADFRARGGAQLGNWVRALSAAVRRVRQVPELAPAVEKLRAYLATDDVTDRRTRAQICVDAALMLAALHRYEDAASLLRETEAAAASWPDIARAADGARIEIAITQGHYKDALRALHRVSALRAGDTTEQHRLRIQEAQALAALGEHDEALRALRQAEELTSSTDLVHRCERERVRATVLGYAGDWHAAALVAGQAGALAREARLPHEVAIAFHLQGVALVRCSDLAGAYVALERSLSAARTIGADRVENLDSMVLGYLDAAKGSPAALALLSAGIDRAEEQQWTADELLGRTLRGRLLAQRGRRDAALAELNAALAMATELGNLSAAADCQHLIEQVTGHGQRAVGQR